MGCKTTSCQLSNYAVCFTTGKSIFQILSGHCTAEYHSALYPAEGFSLAARGMPGFPLLSLGNVLYLDTLSKKIHAILCPSRRGELRSPLSALEGLYKQPLYPTRDDVPGLCLFYFKVCTDVCFSILQELCPGSLSHSYFTKYARSFFSFQICFLSWGTCLEAVQGLRPIISLIKVNVVGILLLGNFRTTQASILYYL